MSLRNTKRKAFSSPIKGRGSIISDVEEENDFSEDEELTHNLHRNGSNSSFLKKILFVSLMIGAAVVISAYTAISIPKYSSSEEVIRQMNLVVKEFKSDLRKEREVFISKGSGYGTEIKNSLDDFYAKIEKSFISRKEVESKIKEVSSKVSEMNRDIRSELSKSMENQKVKSESSTKKMEKELSKMKESVSTLEKNFEDKEFVKKLEHTVMERMKTLEDNLTELKTQSEKRYIKNGTEEEVVTRKEFQTEIETLKKKFEIRNLHRAFSDARDGLQIDWANRRSGGIVVSTMNKFVSILSLRFPSKNILIQSFGGPGECFPFKASGGYAVISLRKEIYPTAFSYETVHPSVNPTKGSGPRKVRVRAVIGKKLIDLTPNNSPIELAENETLQTLPLAGNENRIKTDRIRFDFDENFGHPLVTCVYRLRVHGVPAKNM